MQPASRTNSSGVNAARRSTGVRLALAWSAPGQRRSLVAISAASGTGAACAARNPPASCAAGFRPGSRAGVRAGMCVWGIGGGGGRLKLTRALAP